MAKGGEMFEIAQLKLYETIQAQVHSTYEAQTKLQGHIHANPIAREPKLNTPTVYINTLK